MSSQQTFTTKHLIVGSELRDRFSGGINSNDEVDHERIARFAFASLLFMLPQGGGANL